MRNRNFDVDDDDEFLYQKINSIVDDILGDKISIVQKLELYNYFLYKKNQVLREYANSYSNIQSYSNPNFNTYFGSYQSPSINQPYYMQSGNFYPQKMLPPSTQMQAPQFFQQPLQQPLQFNPYFNQIPQPVPVPNKDSKSDSESDSESESKSSSESESKSDSESESKKHHHHHKKDKKKSRKDKKSKEKKSKGKKAKAKKGKGKKKAPKTENKDEIAPVDDPDLEKFNDVD